MTILVTGGTGNVGGALLRLLSAAGVPARALVRRDAPLPPGVVPVRGDLTRPDSLDAALDGVDRVFLVWPVDDGHAADVVARLAGRRVVYLSTQGAREAADADPITRSHGTLERLVREAADEWTLLRAGGFAANTLGWAEQVRRDRTVRWPYGAAARSLVHELDLAAVAQVALTTDDLVGATPHLTGPEVLTQVEQVAAIGAALGEPVRWEELSRAEAHEQMVGWGWPEATVTGALDAWAAMAEHPETVSGDVERLLGRPATPYAQWVRDHLEAFR